MPELPEVETTKTGLHQLITGQTIESVEIFKPKLRWDIPSHLSNSINKKSVLSVNRLAKYLLIEFDNGTLIIHLGMSGSLSVVAQSCGLNKHEHFVVNFTNQSSMRLKDPRRFGAVLWCDKNETHSLLANLGIEPLKNEFNAYYLYQSFRGKKRSIKSLITDSKIIVGIGNIYALEALFMAKISPLTLVNQLNKRHSTVLVTAIKTVLTEAITQGGTTLKDFSNVDKKPGYFVQKLAVYGRAGMACVNCLGIIIQVKQNNRSSYYCPFCQK